MHKISVIIPIYNVEKYLVKCLDSVINQTYKNLEIICVNDCSPDNSEKIVKEYAQKDKRILLFNREKNGGLSAARNSGLNIATGDYIYFLDSDDWIDLNYLEEMYNAAKQNRAVVVLNTNIIREEAGKPKMQFLPDLCPKNINNTYISTDKCIWNIVWNTWAYLWEKTFLDKLNARFPEGFINEDMFFQAITLSTLNEVYVIRNSAYHYLVRKTSISDELKTKRSTENLSIIKILNKTADYFENKDILDSVYIKLFVLITICDSDQKQFILEKLRQYFVRIKRNVEKNKNLYNEIELKMFYDVLNNSSKAITTNYYKEYLFYSIRKGLNINNGNSISNNSNL